MDRPNRRHGRNHLSLGVFAVPPIGVYNVLPVVYDALTDLWIAALKRVRVAAA